MSHVYPILRFNGCRPASGRHPRLFPERSAHGVDVGQGQ
ncbi:hypothetical protein C4K30_3202 [Pseudomonas chlororaphis subsp. piscium]|nr:hypothetical protein C4K30_3202 [Pseudomonas chlororaphis subsp. piscium]